jgi:hypothetical protein
MAGLGRIRNVRFGLEGQSLLATTSRSCWTADKGRFQEALTAVRTFHMSRFVP